MEGVETDGWVTEMVRYVIFLFELIFWPNHSLYTYICRLYKNME